MHPDRKKLIREIESIKTTLVKRATGELVTSDDVECYVASRETILANPVTKTRVPELLHSCRRPDDFWPIAKSKFGTYADRRNYVREEFEPLLRYLEGHHVGPADENVSLTLAGAPTEFVHLTWQKALARRENDPEGAVTSARALLESTAKYVLDQRGVEYKDSADLPTLYKAAARALNLAPAQHVEPIFKQILNGCQTVVEGVGALRNKLGDAHGHGVRGVRPLPRHAELAVNLAGAAATFLISTLEAMKAKESS